MSPCNIKGTNFKQKTYFLVEFLISYFNCLLCSFLMINNKFEIRLTSIQDRTLFVKSIYHRIDGSEAGTSNTNNNQSGKNIFFFPFFQYNRQGVSFIESKEPGNPIEKFGSAR